MSRASSVFHTPNECFAQETFAKSYSTPENSKSTSNQHELVEYIVRRYGIQVPKDFYKQLKTANTRFRNTSFSMPLKTVDSIIRCCNLWKEYIYVEDYDKLVCGELLSMAGIHTSVLSARNFEEQQGLKLKKQPSYTFVTIVDQHGGIRIFD